MRGQPRRYLADPPSIKPVRLAPRIEHGSGAVTSWMYRTRGRSADVILEVQRAVTRADGHIVVTVVSVRVPYPRKRRKMGRPA